MLMIAKDLRGEQDKCHNGGKKRYEKSEKQLLQTALKKQRPGRRS